MTEIIYAGIGSRTTPAPILIKMRNAARGMAKIGFVLRSGGEEGADRAFEEGHDLSGVTGKKEIYLPYKFFRKNDSPLYGTTKEARAIAREIHPDWPVLGDRGRDFMGRSAYQILGLDLKTPSHFVLCWTPGGKVTGATGQALRHANKLGIPVLNFATHSDDEISDFIFAIHERLSS